MTVGALETLKATLAAANLSLYNVGCLELAKHRETIAGSDATRRQAILEQWDSFLQTLAAADVRVTTFTWEATGKVFSSGSVAVRGGALGRYVDGPSVAQDADVAVAESVLWSNMEAFISAVLPLLERYKVRLLFVFVYFLFYCINCERLSVLTGTIFIFLFVLLYIYIARDSHCALTIIIAIRLF